MEKAQPQLADELFAHLRDASNFKCDTTAQAKTMSDGFVKLFSEFLDAPGSAPNDVKGQYRGHCNVTACQKPGADYWNLSTRAWYCRECADKINYNPAEIVCIPHYQLPMHGGLPKADLRTLAFMFLTADPRKALNATEHKEIHRTSSWDYRLGYSEAKTVLLSLLMQAYLFSGNPDTEKLAQLILDLEEGSDYDIELSKRAMYFAEIPALLSLFGGIKARLNEVEGDNPSSVALRLEEVIEGFKIRWEQPFPLSDVKRETP